MISKLNVEDVLRKATDDEQRAQQLVTVEGKQTDLMFDLRHLAAFDSNPLDMQRLRNNDSREEYLNELTRDNCQLIINQIWSTLETARVDNVITAILPSLPVYNLPRAKPIPKPKQPTKWELFARSKGIQKKKKERMVWDEVSQQWRTRYGYRSIGQQKQANEWMMEVPDQADPNKDFFAEKIHEREERVAKNELQRLRNLSRNQKFKLTGLLPNQTSDENVTKKDDIIRAKYLVEEKSNASMGKFFQVEPIDKSTSTDKKKLPGARRKFDSNFQKNLTDEKRKNLDIVDRVLREQKQSIKDDDSNEQATIKRLKRMNSKIRKVSKERRQAAEDNDDNEHFGKTKRKNNKNPRGKSMANKIKNSNLSKKPTKTNRSLKKFQNKQRKSKGVK